MMCYDVCPTSSGHGHHDWLTTPCTWHFVNVPNSPDIPLTRTLFPSQGVQDRARFHYMIFIINFRYPLWCWLEPKAALEMYWRGTPHWWGILEPTELIPIPFPWNPTVVILEAPIGQTSDVWVLVEPLVAKTTKVKHDYYYGGCVWYDNIALFRCVHTTELDWDSVTGHTKWAVGGGGGG